MRTHSRYCYWIVSVAVAIIAIPFVAATTGGGAGIAATQERQETQESQEAQEAKETQEARQDSASAGLSPDGYDLPDSLRTTITGTVIEIESHIERDGGLYCWLDTGAKEPFQITFGSLRTRPPPSEERLKLYEIVRDLKPGDVIQAVGYMLEDGFWLTGIKRIETE